MQLTTLDVPNDEALNAYIDAGKLRGKDLVIGGVTEGQIRAISLPQDTTTTSFPSARPAISRRVKAVSS